MVLETVQSQKIKIAKLPYMYQEFFVIIMMGHSTIYEVKYRSTSEYHHWSPGISLGISKQ